MPSPKRKIEEAELEVMPALKKVRLSPIEDDDDSDDDLELCEVMEKLVVRNTLLSIPGELRNRIYRMTFEDGDKDGTVTLNSSTFPEPALLSVCTQIRDEAGPIFYSERIFAIDMTAFASDAWGLFVQKRNDVLEEFGVEMPSRRFGVWTPNWPNLLIQLRRWHKGCFAGWNRGSYEGLLPTTHEMAFAMMDMVIDLEDMPWSKVEKILERYHRALITVDVRWT